MQFTLPLLGIPYKHRSLVLQNSTYYSTSTDQYTQSQKGQYPYSTTYNYSYWEMYPLR